MVKSSILIIAELTITCCDWQGGSRSQLNPKQDENESQHFLHCRWFNLRIWLEVDTTVYIELTSD